MNTEIASPLDTTSQELLDSLEQLGSEASPDTSQAASALENDSQRPAAGRPC